MARIKVEFIDQGSEQLKYCNPKDTVSVKVNSSM